MRRAILWLIAITLWALIAWWVVELQEFDDSPMDEGG